MFGVWADQRSRSDQIIEYLLGDALALEKFRQVLGEGGHGPAGVGGGAAGQRCGQLADVVQQTLALGTAVAGVGGGRTTRF